QSYRRWFPGLLLSLRTDFFLSCQVLNAPNQAVHVIVEIPARPHLGGVAVGESLQLLRQMSLAWHGRPADQDGDHRDATLQGRLDLDTDEVAGIVQSTLALLRP